MYENRCQVCLVEVKTDGAENQKDGKGLYIVENSRSMYERAKEHQRDRVKHWALDHPELQSSSSSILSLPLLTLC